jgi:hypothetical protein
MFAELLGLLNYYISIKKLVRKKKGFASLVEALDCVIFLLSLGFCRDDFFNFGFG